MISAKNVHIIGIGGIGTSAVAKWWHAHGATVTGSDVHSSDLIDDLMKRGIDVRLGHFSENVPRECDLVVYSRAVPAANVEREIASERGITQLSFPEFLGEMAKEKKTIAVSGTNGKSTTTGMIASILVEAGLDPTVIIGTKVPGWDDGNLLLGDGNWLVVEACEHLASFLEIKPDVALVTNIEEDHLDFYRDLDHIRETFQQWIGSVKDGGVVVLNEQDDESMKLEAPEAKRFHAKDREVEPGKQTFTVGNKRFVLKVPGEFNASNAAAAAVAASALEIESETIVAALANFTGTWRRFERVGEWKPGSMKVRPGAGVDVFSDYAHHPTAIAGTIDAFREFYPDRRLVVVFEPHQHSRTHELFDEFVESFDGVDVLILSEIYEVTGRTEEKFESSEDMARAVGSRGHVKEVQSAEDLQEAERRLRDLVKNQDLVVCMGAGAIDSLARKLV